MKTITNLLAGCMGAIVMLSVSACNRPTATPATRPATRASSPATMPSVAVLTVNGVPITFDSPRATVDRHDGANRLLIYSDSANASGSFYFEVPIEGDWPGGGALEWEMRVEQKERAETLVGIEGPDRTLQPVRLAVTVQPADGGLVQVVLHGRFQVYAGDSDDPAGEAAVDAAFVAGLVDAVR